LNYSNVVNTSRVKIPFGIAQIGKAFRNEISPRQFIFRLRELEQMEMQYFVEPNQEMDEYQKLKQKRWAYYINDLGIKEENIRWKEHENLVFYAKAAYDIEYNFPGGFKELEGIHARGNYDLSQHSKFSGKDLSYFDPATSTKYIPHIIESSVGVSRTMLAILTDSYHKEEIEGEESRVVLKIKPSLAPIKAAILPLMKKADLTCLAEEIFNNLLAGTNLNIDYDDSGSIGKRYRRQDEIGTPFCITIDFQSLEDSTVTIRYRDSMEQKRISTNDLQREVVDNISNN
jgi:glycyl-tRNA synthetase